MGKTALAINMAQNAAVNHGAVVAVFSLEMSKESLLRRMLASQAWVDQRKLQTGFIPREDRERLNNALNSLVESRTVHRRYGGNLHGGDARQGKAAEAAGGRVLDLVVVDYLQLMTATLPANGGKRYENRTQEVSAISRGSESAGQGTACAGGGVVAALARQRAPRRRQAADAERSARVGLH